MAYPAPKDSWAVVMIRGGKWIAVKRSTGILTEGAAKEKAAKKNTADARNRKRFSK